MRLPIAVAFLALSCGQETIFVETAACDGLAQNVEDGVDAPFDRDGDGYFDGGDEQCAATYPAELLDCDDLNPDIGPGATEITCNGIDEDCDPETSDTPDGDGDGASVCEDCNDLDQTIAPSLDEICGDEIDNNCNDEIDEGCEGLSGLYNLDSRITYTCAMRSVDIDFDAFVLEVFHPLIRVTSLRHCATLSSWIRPAVVV